MNAMLTVDQATKRFGNILALDQVSLQVRAGELVGLLGPNGAGKTTLISLIAGLRVPDQGTVQLLGKDPRKPDTRMVLGITPQETGLNESLTVREIIDYTRGHYSNPLAVDELVTQLGLADFLDQRCGKLSGGQARRVSVALAFAGRPQLVVLDEPTTGLDIESRHALWDAIAHYHANGGTVLLSSHYLEEIEALAKRVVVMGNGRIIADDKLPEILKRVAIRQASFTLESGLLEKETFTKLFPEAIVSIADERVIISAGDTDQVVRALVQAGIDFRNLSIRGATLEEAFVHIVADDNQVRSAV